MPLLAKALLWGLAALLFSQEVLAARCLYVSSYHAGYEWNDGIEQGMEAVLNGKCQLKKFYMDGRRNLDDGFARKKALEAKALIDSWKPDVIIAADDNASKYLVMPYLKNAVVPVVFCGINWTAEPYGYPYTNATGMIEVGPIEQLMSEVRELVQGARHGVFLSVDEITAYKEFAMNKELYAKHGIALRHLPVKTMEEWEAGYLEAQRTDFIILGNNAGIQGWDKTRAKDFAYEHARKFSVSYLDWMAPYGVLTMAKIADEQGEWAAKVALMILQGASPRSIPIVANRRWNMFVNPRLLNRTGLNLSSDILRKAIKVRD